MPVSHQNFEKSDQEKIQLNSFDPKELDLIL